MVNRLNTAASINRYLATRRVMKMLRRKPHGAQGAAASAGKATLSCFQGLPPLAAKIAHSRARDGRIYPS